MLALCLMLLPSYYAQNYAGIIGSSLITVTCTINPDSTADMCRVMATANDQTFISNEHEHTYT